MFARNLHIVTDHVPHEGAIFARNSDFTAVPLRIDGQNDLISRAIAPAREGWNLRSGTHPIDADVQALDAGSGEGAHEGERVAGYVRQLGARGLFTEACVETA